LIVSGRWPELLLKPVSPESSTIATKFKGDDAALELGRAISPLDDHPDYPASRPMT
jgi:hypothetical protein